MDRSVITFALRQSPLFGTVSDATLAEVVDIAMRTRHVAGERVIGEGGPSDSLYVVVTGTLRVVSRGPDGRETTYRMLGPGSVFGEIGILDGQPRSADVVSVTDAVCLRIPRVPFVHIVRQRGDLAAAMFQMLAASVRRLSEQVKETGSLDARARLSLHLIRLANARSTPTEEGLVVEEHVSQAVLASSLGLSRQTVNRLLRELQDEHLIRVRRASIVLLDPERLAPTAG